MQWDAERYETHHGFVARYGQSLLDEAGDLRGRHVLDLGCGTGALSAELAGHGALVTGVDSSAVMTAKARALHPGLAFLEMDACELPWKDVFDLVFSNAVFHWISRQDRLLAAVFSALRPGGALLCEFGGRGNIARMQGTFQAAARAHGHECRSAFFFPDREEYLALLEGAGFTNCAVRVYDRPTPLQEGRAGLRHWALQFFAADLDSMPPPTRQAVLADMERRLESMAWDGVRWTADYRRIRVVARKPA